jgi:DNA polymerase III alpha subunit
MVHARDVCLMPSPSAAPVYAELAACSNFSFLRGASHPEELVVTAKRLGLRGLGLADRNTVSGTVRAHMAAKEAGLSYHPGARLVFADGTPDVLAYPVDRRGWGHLCRLLTAANMRGEKGDPAIVESDLMDWGDDLALAVLPKPAAFDETCLVFLRRLKARFGPAVRLALTPAYDGGDRATLEAGRALANAAGVRLMAVGNVHYHDTSRRPLADTLAAIREHAPLSQAGYLLSPNAERYPRTGADRRARLRALFPHRHDIVRFSPARRTSSARGAARRPIPRSASASASPRSTRQGRPPVRALHLAGAQRAARHRRRFRA